MNKRLVLLLVVIGLVGVSEAVVIDISDDTTITSGNYDWLRVDYGLPLNNSQMDIQGGNIGIYHTYGTSYTLIDGTATLSSVGSYDSSVIDIYGGTINGVGSSGGVVNLHYLTPVSDYVYASVSEAGKLNIYGYGFEWAFSGSSAYYTGHWLNGEPIVFYFRGYLESTLENVNVIPEPTSFLILITGAILLRARNSK